MSFSAINWLLVGRVASSPEKLNSWLRRSACVFSSTLKRLLLPVEEPCGADGRCGVALGVALLVDGVLLADTLEGREFPF
jgi:hypothetical protein